MRLRNYINPAYHLHRMKDDLVVTLRVFKARKLALPRDNAVALAEMFKGRLFSCFFLSGPFALLGAFMATVTQYTKRSAEVGLYSTVPWVMLLTTIAFQIFWWMHNRGLYINHYKSRVDAVWALEKDLVRVHVTGILYATAFSVIGFLVIQPIIVILRLYLKEKIDWIPMSVLFLAVDFVLIQSPYFRIMSNLFEKQSHVLAARYSLCEKSEAA